MFKLGSVKDFLMNIKVWKANQNKLYNNRVNEVISGSDDTKPRTV